MRWAERVGASDYHEKQKEFYVKDYVLQINFNRKIPVTNPQMHRK